MTHIESETLATIAMTDAPPTPEDEAHLAVCSRCADELSSLDRVVRLGRSTEHVELVAPPASVWEGIRDELGRAESAANGTRDAGPTPPRRLHRPGALGRGRSRTASGPRRRRGIAVTAGALAVGLLAGVGLGAWWQASRLDPSGVVVADATLEAFPGWPGAAGTAVVEERPDGLRQVAVTVDEAVGAEAGDGLREVWLLRTDGSGLISIGYLTGAEGRFDLPRGLDLADYAIVDVSAEDDDGDPAHSADSIVRGELRVG